MRYNLSEIVELIKNRRTIYPEFFTSRKVHQEQVELLLNAAIWAPTHGKTQPWRFTVFMDDSREDLATFLSETYLKCTPEEEQKDSKLAKMLNRPKQSTAIIAVHMHRTTDTRIPEHEEYAAVCAAVQNMLLVATAYGLGSFWSTPKFLDSPESRQFFDLGANDKCLGLIYLGYSKEEWPKGQRRPIEYLTEWRTR